MKKTARLGRTLTATFAAASMTLGLGVAVADAAPTPEPSLNGITTNYVDVGTVESQQRTLDLLTATGDDWIDDNPSQAGYDRNAQFGNWKSPKVEYGWNEEFLNELPSGCTARDAVMIMGALPGTLEVTGKCKVSGKWRDGYGYVDTKTPGDEMEPFYESEDPSTFDMEHIVAIGDAYRSGAKPDQMPDETRYSIYNDPMNLAVSDASANRFKSAKGPTDYLPPNPDFECEYAERYTNVKLKYGLTFTSDDKQTLVDKLGECVQR